jgi:basic membrane protein A
MKKNLTWMCIICFILFTGSVVMAMPQGEKKTENKPLLVSMATDIGGLGDKSFNDGCYAGLEKARDELGLEIKVVESKQMTDYVPNLSGLAEDGSTLVFAVGFLMADAIIESAQHHPDSYFAGIDIWIDPASAPANILGINYKEQESGYLAGIVAGLLTEKYAGVSSKLNDKNVLGMVLGMDIPPVERYQAGFYAGVMSVNPDCSVISIVTGVFDDQAKGKEATIVLAEQGADIVFQIAGLTGLGVINGAKEKGILAIGVDVDQNYIAPDTVITSAVKGITESTFLIIKSVQEGKFQGGQNLLFGLKENSTGISPYHGFDSVIPQEVKDKVNQVIKDIKSGKAIVPAIRADAGYEQ